MLENRGAISLDTTKYVSGLTAATVALTSFNTKAAASSAAQQDMTEKALAAHAAFGPMTQDLARLSSAVSSLNGQMRAMQGLATKASYTSSGAKDIMSQMGLSPTLYDEMDRSNRKMRESLFQVGSIRQLATEQASAYIRHYNSMLSQITTGVRQANATQGRVFNRLLPAAQAANKAGILASQQLSKSEMAMLRADAEAPYRSASATHAKEQSALSEMDATRSLQAQRKMLESKLATGTKQLAALDPAINMIRQVQAWAKTVLPDLSTAQRRDPNALAAQMRPYRTTTLPSGVEIRDAFDPNANITVGKSTFSLATAVTALKGAYEMIVPELSKDIAKKSAGTQYTSALEMQREARNMTNPAVARELAEVNARLNARGPVYATDYQSQERKVAQTKAAMGEAQSQIPANYEALASHRISGNVRIATEQAVKNLQVTADRAKEIVTTAGTLDKLGGISTKSKQAVVDRMIAGGSIDLEGIKATNTKNQAGRIDWLYNKLSERVGTGPGAEKARDAIYQKLYGSDLSAINFEEFAKKMDQWKGATGDVKRKLEMELTKRFKAPFEAAKLAEEAAVKAAIANVQSAKSLDAGALREKFTQGKGLSLQQELITAQQIDRINTLHGQQAKANPNWTGADTMQLVDDLRSGDPKRMQEATAKNAHMAAAVGMLNNALDTNAERWSRVNRALTSFGHMFGGRVLSLAFYTMANYLREAVTEATKLSRSIAEIQTISQSAARTQTSWAADIRSISSATGFGQTDVSEAFYQTLSNQVAKGEAATGFVKEASKFALTTQATLTQSVDLLSSAINAYGYSASAAEMISAQFFKTIELGRVRSSELGNTFGRIAMQANLASVNLASINSALAQLTTAGVKPERAITYLTNVLSKFAKPTDPMKEMFKEWGVYSGEAALQIYGLDGVIEKLGREGAANLSEISDLFKDMRALIPIAGMTTGSARITAWKKEIEGSVDDYRRAQAYMTDSAGFVMDRELNKIKIVFQQIGTNIVKAVAWSAKTLEKYGLSSPGPIAAGAIGATTAAGAAAWGLGLLAPLGLALPPLGAAAVIGGAGLLGAGALASAASGGPTAEDEYVKQRLRGPVTPDLAKKLMTGKGYGSAWLVGNSTTTFDPTLGPRAEYQAAISYYTRMSKQVLEEHTAALIAMEKGASKEIRKIQEDTNDAIKKLLPQTNKLREAMDSSLGTFFDSLKSQRASNDGRYGIMESARSWGLRSAQAQSPEFMSGILRGNYARQLAGISTGNVGYDAKMQAQSVTEAGTAIEEINSVLLAVQKSLSAPPDASFIARMQQGTLSQQEMWQESQEGRLAKIFGPNVNPQYAMQQLLSTRDDLYNWITDSANLGTDYESEMLAAYKATQDSAVSLAEIEKFVKKLAERIEGGYVTDLAAALKASPYGGTVDPATADALAAYIANRKTRQDLEDEATRGTRAINLSRQNGAWTTGFFGNEQAMAKQYGTQLSVFDQLVRPHLENMNKLTYNLRDKDSNEAFVYAAKSAQKNMLGILDPAELAKQQEAYANATRAVTAGLIKPNTPEYNTALSIINDSVVGLAARIGAMITSAGTAVPVLGQPIGDLTLAGREWGNAAGTNAMTVDQFNTAASQYVQQPGGMAPSVPMQPDPALESTQAQSRRGFVNINVLASGNNRLDAVRLGDQVSRQMYNRRARIGVAPARV